MNSRLESLISRGYPKEDVVRLASFNEEELEYACEKAFKHISKNCFSVDNPRAIFIGGQPGCGKTVMSMALKNKIRNAIEIGIDNYRMYHPHYLEIENYIKNFWKNRKESIDDSPGNDIADFTHYFAGIMTDKLIEKASNNKYNLLLEWGMREPNGPLGCMKSLKEKGYINTVLFISINKNISYQACNLRASIMKNCNHIIRKVPKSFHDYCIETLPDSINKIYSDGYRNGIVDYMALITRRGNLICDYKDKELPGKIFSSYLNDCNFTKNNILLSIKNNMKEMQGLRKNIFYYFQGDLTYLNSHSINKK